MSDTLFRKGRTRLPGELKTSIIRNAEGEPVRLATNTGEITERKMAEEIFQTVSLRSPVGIYIVQDGEFVFANPQFLSDLGWTEAELLGVNSLASVRAEDREMVRQNAVEMLKGIRTAPYEYEVANSAGETRWFMETVTPIQYRGSRAVLGSVLDITERKQTEERLRETRRRFRDLVNLLPLGIYEMDDKYNVTFANRQAIEASGYTEEEVNATPSNALDTVTPEDRERMERNIRRIMNGEKLGGIEYTQRRKDGSTYPAMIYSTPIMRDGKAVGLRGVIIDITERKQAEEAIKAQRDLIDHILATIPDAVLVIGKDNSVILANAAFYDTFGIKRREVVGRSLSELIPEPGLLESLPKILTGEKPQIDLEFRQKFNGDKKTLIATVMKMGEKEALLILNDVTEERQKQERLFLTDRLSSIGEMSAGVAHELNNPLTGIVSLSQLLLEDNPPDELREDITDIHNEAQRAASIVRNLLTFSRKHAPMREPTQLNGVIEDVLRLRDYEHKVNNINVETQLAPDLPEVIVDYHQMQQVFLNIVLNAESALTEEHEPGTLTITTSRLNSNVRVSFSDDGPGIPQKNLNRVFDPFFTTKEVGKGTGLGLSICYGIVTQHGGKIHAENKAGKGATFVVELPIEGQKVMEKSYEKCQ